MFWGPSVWAGLRAGDAGNAEEELGVQQNTLAVYLTGRVALARRHTAQLDCIFEITGGFRCFPESMAKGSSAGSLELFS